MIDAAHTDVTGHTLSVAANGSVTSGHPENDVPDCGFDAYVASDWATPPGVYRPSEWEFIRRTDGDTGDTYWLSTKVG